jgi:cytochrome P450
MPIAPPLSWPLPFNRNLRSAIAEFESLVDDILDSRLRNPPTLFLSCLAEQSKSMGRVQMRDEAMTALFGAHETVALALSWTCFLLAKHPETADLIRGEQRNTCRDSPDKTSPTLPGAVLESMRLYPPAWLLERRCVRGDQIGGYDLPANSIVVVSPYVTHRHEDFWDSPEEFIPERFANPKALYRGAFLPFGSGKRMCIGKSLSMLEVCRALAKILERFEMTLPEGFEPTLRPGINLYPERDIKIGLAKRSGERLVA